MSREELEVEELRLKLEKLRSETADLNSPWNRIGKWLPLMVALITVGYSVAVFDAKKTLNEAAAVKAEKATQEEIQKKADVQRERERLAGEVDDLKKQASALAVEAQRLRPLATSAETRSTISDIGTKAQAIASMPSERVFVHIFSERDRAEAERLRSIVQVQKIGRFQGIENVEGQRLMSPKAPEVRFFNEEDRGFADHLAKAISTADIAYNSRLVTAVSASGGTIEIWLPK